MSGTPVREALQGAMTAIGAAGCETPRLDAEVLLADVLGVGRERLLTDPDLSVHGPAVRAFQNAVRRRAVEREPVAYITGRRGFRHIELAVDHRALVPRPETELLVEAGSSSRRAPPCWTSCTGSGAVALALKQERPDLEVWGSDVSEAALGLARENAAGSGSRWAGSPPICSTACEDRFDAVLANPPYVADSERASLAPEILRHEPAQALFAGPDGLAVIAPLIAQLGTRARAPERGDRGRRGAGRAGRVAARAGGFRKR